MRALSKCDMQLGRVLATWMAIALTSCVSGRPAKRPAVEVATCEGAHPDFRAAGALSGPVARGLRYAADRAWVVYVEPTSLGGKITLARADGSDARQLTDGSEDDRDPTFHPDGERIIFASKRAGSVDLWSVRRDGSGLTRVTDLPGDESSPDVSPTAFEVETGVRRFDPSQGHQVETTTLARFHKIVFERCHEGRCHIAAVSDTGHAGEQLSLKGENCRRPRWAPSGRELTYVCGNHLQWVEYGPFRDGYLAEGSVPSWPAVQDVLSPGPPSSVAIIGSFVGFEHPIISPNGVWMLADRVEEGRVESWLVRRDGRERKLLQRGVVAEAVGWSADGARTLWSLGETKTSLLCAAESGIALGDVDNLYAYPELYGATQGSPLETNRFALIDTPARNFGGEWVERVDGPVGMPTVGPIDRGKLITSDAVLDGLHVAFDGAFMRLERDVLAPRLRGLLQALALRAGARFLSSGAEADRRLAVLLGVAHALVEEAVPLGPALGLGGSPSRKIQLRNAVRSTLAVIHAGINSVESVRELTALALPAIDLSELKPRSHYDRKGLRGYFRAVMWLSRARLDGAGAAVRVYELLRAANLYEQYRAIYRVYSLFVGRAEDGSPHAIGDIVEAHPGWKGADLHAWLEAQATQQLRGPSVMPNEQGGSSKRFYVFPARPTPDGQVLQRFSFSDTDRPRLPSPLDVMAVLGSSRAAVHAPDQRGFPYGPLLANLRGQAPTLFRTDDTYGSWLAALAALVDDPDEATLDALPPFARTAAYRDKLLHTALAGYTALKHDTLLATKPPRVRMGGVHLRDTWLTERQVLPAPLSYVEPTPHFYERLVSYAKQAEGALRGLGPEASDDAERFERWRERILTPLSEIVGRQLRHEPLTEGHSAALARIQAAIRGDWFGDAGEAFLGPDRPPRGPCLIADIFNDHRHHRLRAIAVGDVLPMVAIIPSGSRQRLAHGGSFSFYQLDLPLHDRPTDSSWCGQVGASPPPHPAWARRFLQPN